MMLPRTGSETWWVDPQECLGGAPGLTGQASGQDYPTDWVE
jgi:hypothetical protein